MKRKKQKSSHTERSPDVFCRDEVEGCCKKTALSAVFDFVRPDKERLGSLCSD